MKPRKGRAKKENHLQRESQSSAGMKALFLVCTEKKNARGEKRERESPKDMGYSLIPSFHTKGGGKEEVMSVLRPGFYY